VDLEVMRLDDGALSLFANKVERETR